jgi:alkylated DNA repair protein alkB family protein 4
MVKQLSMESFVSGGKKKTSNMLSQRPTKRSNKKGSSFDKCPLCAVSFPLHKLEAHAADCVGELSSEKQSANRVKALNTKLQPTSEPLPGLFMFEDFISPEEETRIMDQLDGKDEQREGDFLPWTLSNINGQHMGKRWGAHCTQFGLKSNQSKAPLPHFVTNILLDKLNGLICMQGILPNEANALDYLQDKGHYLKAHVDDRKLAHEPIANISLVGDCFMTFTNIAPLRNTAIAYKRVLLKRRCLQVMTGKARYDFTHAIENADLLSQRRVSVTMRRATAPPSVQHSISSQQFWWTNHTQSSSNTKRPTATEPIPGLFLFEDFLTNEEEAQILAELDTHDTSHSQPWVQEHHTGAHNEKRFGIDHDLWSKHLRHPIHPMPSWFHELILPKLRDVVALNGSVPNEMNVIEYKRLDGHFLKSHMDDRGKYKEPIVNLSLAGECWMTFGHERDKSLPKKKVLLKRRMLQVLTGKARYEWNHGIDVSDILSDRRVSVTMRETVGKV